MLAPQVLYETLLADYSNHQDAIDLLRRYRPYFELIPSLRRPAESVISLPLPVVRVVQVSDRSSVHQQLSCDIALLLCDPEWKVKTDHEIFIFIHRPEEDFSGLLTRWRQIEILVGQEYSWVMPWKHRHIISEKGRLHFPLFVTMTYTPERIRRGLVGAGLPFVDVKMPEFPIATPPEDIPAETSTEEQT
ncbi:MAG: hypothetical protein RMK91_07085 [Pseudanabaenaceae cyanobacterium SKYGB_i_bin29]|nr:hypothetical protein [Pseudanabaenaceae cyanobacterium SKYG29]MDW8421617.1 hypothetical protein [Pseudanabaenaceae cyanobacterium SKYGB_i_bin29]